MCRRGNISGWCLYGMSLAISSLVEWQVRHRQAVRPERFGDSAQACRRMDFGVSGKAKLKFAGDRPAPFTFSVSPGKVTQRSRPRRAGPSGFSALLSGRAAVIHEAPFVARTVLIGGPEGGETRSLQRARRITRLVASDPAFHILPSGVCRFNPESAQRQVQAKTA